MGVNARSLWLLGLLSATTACGSETSSGAAPSDAAGEGGSDASALPDAPAPEVGGSDGGASDAAVSDPGGKVAFVNTYPSAFGGARVAAVPGGGWVAAFGHSTAITVAGKTFTPSGRYDLLLLRLQADGSVAWAQPIVGGDDDDVGGLAVDAESIYVSGKSFSKTLDFGNGKTTGTVGAGLSSIGFVAKFDAKGVAQWARRVSSPGGVGLTVVAAEKWDKASDAVIFAGTYTSSGDLLTYPTSAGDANGPDFMSRTTSRGFVLKLAASDGAAQWISLVGAGDNAAVTQVAANSGLTPMLAGWYSAGALLSSGGDTLVPAPAPGTDGAFVAALTLSNGKISSGRALPGARVSASVLGGIITGGTFSGTVDLGKGPSTSAGATDVWLAGGYATGGSPVWAKTFGALGKDSAAALGSSYDDGNCAVAVQTEGGEAKVDGLTLPSAPGAYVVRFSPKEARWARGFAAATPNRVALSDVALSASGTAVIGTFQGTVDLGKGPQASASTSGRSDTFIVGMSP